VSFPYSNIQPVSPTQGLGPSPSIAIDNTLGSRSPFQGRIYAAFVTRPTTNGTPNTNPPDNTNVNLLFSDNGGLTWTAAGSVNTDNAALDGFSEAGTASATTGTGSPRTTGRAQWMPTVAVDQSTGTLLVQFADARWDAARVRYANTLAVSIDGGRTFSEDFLNSPKQAVDTITENTITLEPIPNNPSTIGGNAQTTYGFGDHQGLVVTGPGRVYSVWAGNLNNIGSNIIGVSASYTAGPRIVSGAMGPVTAGPTASDGHTELATFDVTFDRPVDVNSFTPNDVAMFYHSPTDPPVSLGTPVGIASVTPLNAGAAFGPGTRSANLATHFLITLTTPQANVGTYSYIVGPHTAGGPIATNDIHDDIYSPTTSFVTLATNTFDAVSPQVPQTVTDSTTTNSTLAVSGVPAGQVVTGVTVSLNIQNYPFTGDLRISLIAPNNTTVRLFNQRPTPFGGSSNGLGPITFDDAATASLGSGSPPYAGTFRPEVPLKGFQGLSAATANGTWRLQIEDLFPAPPGGDVGQLVSWSMTVNSGTVSVVASPGNFMDQNADASAGAIWSIGGTTGDAFAAPTPIGPTPTPFQFPYDQDTLPLIIPGPHVVNTYVTDANGNPISGAAPENEVLNQTVSSVNVVFDRDMNTNSFTAADVQRVLGPIGEVKGPFTVTANPPGTPPALAQRTFQIGFATQELSGAYTVVLDGNMQAVAKLPDGTPIAADENLNAGIDVLRDQLSLGTASNTTTKTYTSSGANNSVTIPAGGSRSSIIQVPDNFAIQQLSLQLDIAYPNDPDLSATLTAPDGTKVLLFSGVGNVLDPTKRKNFSGTVFDDNATTPIQKGVPPFNLGPYNP
jgi:large repetitive protein